MERLDTWGGTSRSNTVRSTRLDVVSPPETDADAAAGGSRCSSDAGCNNALPLNLPVEARFGGSVASANAVALEQELLDGAVLHSRASLAIDRIAQQQAALRRFPMACPACGVLNAPCGLAWGSGDIVACQSCQNSFVPLGHSLQDSDVTALRMVVQELRKSHERVQYLQQLLHKSSQAVASRPAEVSTVSKQSAVSEAVVSPSLPPVAPIFGRVEGGASPCPQSNDQPAPPSAHNDVPLGPTSDEPDAAQAGEWNGTAVPGGESPQLMSFMNTHDLMTSSSCGSTAGGGSSTPCLLGRKLRQRNLNTETLAFDAVQRARQSVAASRTAGHVSKRCEREDGEITSASEDDSRSIGAWSRPNTPRPHSKHIQTRPYSTKAVGGSGTLAELVRREETPQRKLDEAMPGTAPEPRDVSQGGERASSQCRSLSRAMRQLVVLIGGVLLIRFVLISVICAAGWGEKELPCGLAAILAAAAFGGFSLAQQGLDTRKMMETSRLDWRCRAVSLRLGTSRREMYTLYFTLEEAFGLSVVLSQLSLFCFFESWGLHGPQSFRRAAVLGHALFAVLLTLSVHRWLTKSLELRPDGCSEGVLWFLVAIGNWTTSSCAAVSWWWRATVSCKEVEALEEGFAEGESATASSVSAIALLVVQAVNFWLLRSESEPALLCAFVALAGLSLAFCCYAGTGICADQASALTGATLMLARPAPWTAAIYGAFCVVSAWILWTELIRSL